MSSFKITTFANNLGFNGSLKNLTVPSSCLKLNKLSTLANGYFFISSAKSKSSKPNSY